jgi:hypothetical protein
MTIDTKTGTTRRGRRKAFGLAVTIAALSYGVSADAQTLFPSNSSPLPALPDAQLGTPGTSTVTRGTQTEPGMSQTATQQSGPQVFGATDPYAPTADQQPEGQENAPAAAALRERPYEEDLNQPYAEDIDPGAEPIDQQEAPRQPVDPTGIRLGTFMLRPSVSQSINTESTRTNGARDTRTYLATGIRGTLTSDWSRHALTVTGEGIYERNLRGNQDDTDPEANLNADLRLDLADDTEAHLTAGYNFEREDVSDPNSLGGNAEQAGIHEFSGGASIEREVGRIHGLAAIGATRSIYTDGKLSDGTVVSMKDRNRTGIDGRLRLGYELSPALVPFAELAYGHTFYDRKRDSAGFARSSDTYAGRLGVEFDLGEKMRGEIAGGYQRVAYEDSRLDAVDAFTLDGNVRWSPQRGTDVDLGLRTAVQDATAPGESGWVEYQLNAAVAREVRDNLVARLTGATTFRDFQDSSDNDVTWIVGTGLTWSINRYLDMTADLEYERTAGGATDEDIFRAGVGLTLKR